MKLHNLAIRKTAPKISRLEPDAIASVMSRLVLFIINIISNSFSIIDGSFDWVKGSGLWRDQAPFIHNVNATFCESKIT